MRLMQNKGPLFFGLLIIILAMGADQYSKTFILNYFLENDQPERITDFFNLVLVWNRGVSFGFLSFDMMMMQYILMGGASLIIVCLFVWLCRAQTYYLSFSLSLVIGGAIGNVIDRYQYGAVLDFLDFFWNDMHWPAFNVADAFVSVGVFLIVIEALFDINSKEKA